MSLPRTVPYPTPRIGAASVSSPDISSLMNESTKVTFRAVIGKLWHDPVISKIIAAAIIASLTILIVFLRDFLRDKPSQRFFLIGLAALWTILLYVYFAKTRFSRRSRKVAFIGIITVAALFCISFGLRHYYRSLPESRIIIVVADFHSLDGIDYGITHHLVEELRAATSKYSDVEIQTLDEIITAKDGSPIARTRGMERKASVVLWGWNLKYQAKAHFEVLKKPVFLKLLRPSVSIPGLAMDAYFDIQTKVAKDLRYLVLLTIALTRFEANDYEETINIITDGRLLNDAPEMVDSSTAYFYRGSAYAFTGNYDNAISDLSQVLELDPHHILAYLNRGAAYKSKGDSERSMADSNKAIELLSERISRGDSRSYEFRGVAFLNARKYSNAVEDFSEVIKRQPGDIESLKYRAWAYERLVDHDHAIADYSEILRFDKVNVYAYTRRGVLHGMNGRLKQALEDIRFALALKPNYADALVARGNISKEERDFDRALVDYSEALKLDHDNVLGYYNRASVYFSKGERERAIADLDEAIKRDPKYDLPYSLRGEANRDKGNYESAIADFSQFIMLNPSDAYVYSMRGALYGFEGKFEECIRDLTKAIELKSDLSESYFNRGGCYYYKNDFDRAIADYDQAIRYKPEDRVAHISREMAYEMKNKAKSLRSPK